MWRRLYGQPCPAASAAHLAAEAASGAAAPATGAGHVCCLPQADRAGGWGGADGGRGGWRAGRMVGGAGAHRSAVTGWFPFQSDCFFALLAGLSHRLECPAPGHVPVNLPML
jgi:hypothetical protein